MLFSAQINSRNGLFLKSFNERLRVAFHINLRFNDTLESDQRGGA